jgi:hypothetical protein
LRYGDDFILFANSENDVIKYKAITVDYINDSLGLAVHTKNTAVIKVSDGLHFLGSTIYAGSHFPENSYISKIYKSSNMYELIAYKACQKSKSHQKQYDWLVHRLITTMRKTK